MPDNGTVLPLQDLQADYDLIAGVATETSPLRQSLDRIWSALKRAEQPEDAPARPEGASDNDTCAVCNGSRIFAAHHGLSARIGYDREMKTVVPHRFVERKEQAESDLRSAVVALLADIDRQQEQYPGTGAYVDSIKSRLEAAING